MKGTSPSRSCGEAAAIGIESAVLNSVGDKQDSFSCWARSLAERRGYWRAVVAIAAKNARLAWAVLHYGEDFRLNRAVV